MGVREAHETRLWPPSPPNAVPHPRMQTAPSSTAIPRQQGCEIVSQPAHTRRFGGVSASPKGRRPGRVGVIAGRLLFERLTPLVGRHRPERERLLRQPRLVGVLAASVVSECHPQGVVGEVDAVHPVVRIAAKFCFPCAIFAFDLQQNDVPLGVA